MISSVVVTFAACGLRWTCDLLVEGLAEITPDRPAPPGLSVNVMGVWDGRGRPVHPRYLAPLLQGAHTRGLVRTAAVEALLEGFAKLQAPESGHVPAWPDLIENPEAALNRYLPLNALESGSLEAGEAEG